jgi:hypothetical protein
MEIDEELTLKLPTLKALLSSKKVPPLQKAESLIKCLETTIHRIATSHLGSTAPASTRPYSSTPTDTLLTTWDAAYNAIGTWLQNTTDVDYPTEAATVNCILDLAAKGFHIPQDRAALTKWWHRPDTSIAVLSATLHRI